MGKVCSSFRDFDGTRLDLYGFGREVDVNLVYRSVLVRIMGKDFEYF